MADSDPASTALARFGAASLAFEDLIVQVGEAVARAQDEMDRSQLAFQQEVARALVEGRLTRLDVPPLNAYTLPETKLSLRIGLSVQASEEGGAPTLAAVPLNATTAGRSDVDLEATTEIDLRFVSVPRSGERSGPPPAALTPEAAARLVADDPRTSEAAAGRALATRADFAPDDRLWCVAHLAGREPVLVGVVDDRRGALAGVAPVPEPPSPADLAPVGPPELHAVTPPRAVHGTVMSVHGDNFLALGGQTRIEVDGRPAPLLRHSMRELAFKLDGEAVRGDVEVITPAGRTGEAGTGAFQPLPSFQGFEPRQGSFDALRQSGTWITVAGRNLRAGCQVRFAGGALAQAVEVLSPTSLRAQVAERARSGPLTLVFGAHEQSLPQAFAVLPRLQRVTPRQGLAGDEITLLGHALGDVAEVVFGPALVPRSAFTLHTPTQIRLRVPAGAGDGPLKARQPVGPDAGVETQSADIFYVVPRVTGFSRRVALPDQVLVVQADGLDPQPEMMTLLFAARTGLTEGPVLSVASDRRSLTTRVPKDAVSGYVLLVRKRIFSSVSPADTSRDSQNKLAVLTAEAAASDVLFEDRFDRADATLDPRWTAEAGQWRVDAGCLASTGNARLATGLGEPRSGLALTAEVLRAGKFGLLLRSQASTGLQLWIDTAAASPSLVFTTIDDRSRTKVVQTDPLPVLPGQDHLLALQAVAGKTSNGAAALVVSVALDQQAVGAYAWSATSLVGLALLADSAAQRWDHVLALKTPVLALPEPALYRFGLVPEPPAAPPLAVTALTPAQGAPGTEVTLVGQALDGAGEVLFGDVPAAILTQQPTRATVRVPEGASTGPVEVRGRGGVVVTSAPLVFRVPPTLSAVVPARVRPGDALSLVGANLPAAADDARVEVLGQPAAVTFASPSLLTLTVPAVAGAGLVRLVHAGFTATAAVTVAPETVLLDLVAEAPSASWSTSAGALDLGRLGARGEATVQVRARERLEDGIEAGPLLYVVPPAPALRAVTGLFAAIDLPAGALELRLVAASPWAGVARGATGGVRVEAALIDDASGAATRVLPRTACFHDGSPERFVLDLSPLAGRRARLALSVYAAQDGATPPLTLRGTIVSVS